MKIGIDDYSAEWLYLTNFLPSDNRPNNNRPEDRDSIQILPDFQQRTDTREHTNSLIPLLTALLSSFEIHVLVLLDDRFPLKTIVIKIFGQLLSRFYSQYI